MYRNHVLTLSKGGYLQMDAILAAGGIANDMPWEDAYPLALQLKQHSRVSFDDQVTEAAYEKSESGELVPVSYIVCEKDLIISPEQQRGYIQVLEEKRGAKVDVSSLEAGHCPNWSVPEELTKVIVEHVRL